MGRVLYVQQQYLPDTYFPPVYPYRYLVYTGIHVIWHEERAFLSGIVKIIYIHVFIFSSKDPFLSGQSIYQNSFRYCYFAGRIYNKVKSCFVLPAGRFHAGLARPIWTPLASPDGKSTGDPPAASLAVALAPSPARRAPTIEKIESISRVTPPVPRGRTGDVKQLWETDILEEKKTIPHIYPMNSDSLYESSGTTPHVDMTRESHPSMCTHHAAPEHALWLPVRDDARCNGIIRVHMQYRA